jgi:DNA-directed RNA polymerase subunit RPC12/RpoP
MTLPSRAEQTLPDRLAHREHEVFVWVKTGIATFPLNEFEPYILPRLLDLLSALRPRKTKPVCVRCGNPVVQIPFNYYIRKYCGACIIVRRRENGIKGGNLRRIHNEVAGD